MTTQFDLAAAPAHAIESFGDLRAIERTLSASEAENAGWPSESLLGKLVEPYMARTVRLVAAPTQHRAELEAFSDHLSRIIAPTSFETPPAALAGYYDQLKSARTFALVGFRYKSRQASRRVDETVSAGAYNTHWKAIAGYLLAAKKTGRKQQEIAAFLAKQANGKAYSSGAVSQMLGSMRMAGWIHTTLQGRTNVHFPGDYLLSNEPLFAPKSEIPLALVTVFDAVCRHQGLINQFNSASGELHRKFREATAAAVDFLFHPEAAPDAVNVNHRVLTQEQIDNQKLKLRENPKAFARFEKLSKKCIEASVALNEYMDERTREACAFSFQFMQTYFLDRGAESVPRIALKGFWPTPGIRTPERLVTTFYGTTKKTRPPSDLDKSSTFSEVLRTGVFNLISDIPQATFDGDYKSSRFDLEKVKLYQDDPVKYPFETCFFDYEKAKSDKSFNNNFYKSSLVVPVSMMLNKDMDESFVAQWAGRFIPSLEHNGKQVVEGRLIFGFLCIDHTQANFFLPGKESNLDVRMAYLFADLLSFYLFQRASLTTGSNHFKLARWLLGEKDEAKLRADFREEKADLKITHTQLDEIKKDLSSRYMEPLEMNGPVNDDALKWRRNPPGRPEAK